MGTTLTGTTPQDTYDSLIKVTDNAPLTGSLKKLTDGLGNDSSLSLSTTAASLSGTLAVTGTSTFSSALTAATNSNFTGTAVNSRVLVTAAGVANTILGFNNSGTTADGVVNNAGYIGILQEYPLVVTMAGAERMRITSAGNVGIGTNAPAEKLSVAGAIITTGAITGHGANRVSISQEGANGAFIQSYGANASTVGAFTFRQASSDFSITQIPLAITTSGVLDILSGIKFPATQVSSADSNTLDDYEEGTWTMGVSFGGASVAVTTLLNSGTYTKIGRQVTLNGRLALTSKGSSTGVVKITGLPFTIANTDSNRSAPSLRLDNISFANAFIGFGAIGSTTINLEEITEAGVVSSLTNADFANNSDIMISFTYFV